MNTKTDHSPLHLHARRRDGMVAAVLVGGMLLVYLVTAYPGVGGRACPGDAAKFQYISRVLGVPHAPGFPLFVLLGHGWSALAGGEAPALAMNIFSALWMAGALAFLFYGLRALGVRWLAAALATLAYAVSEQVWLCATEAGPQALSIFLLMLALCALAHWFATTRAEWLLVAIAAAGIGAGHATVLLWLAPVLLAATLLRRPQAWLRLRPWLMLAGVIAVNVLLYIWLWQRAQAGGPFCEYLTPRATWRDVVRMALGAQFWPNYWQAGMAEIVRVRVPFVLRATLFELHVCGALLALVGMAALWRRAWRAAAVLVVVALVGGAFAAHQYLINPLGSYWVFYLCAAWCAGAGLEVLVGMAGRLRVIVIVLWCLCIGVSVATTITTWSWRQNPYENAELLYALPDKADMLVLDEYSWNEVFKYYRATHP
ncbi:MAG: DUF2723 domain-containing protein [bacterium]|nr:DUF2723 domain-containing protein [bacterium]